VVDDLSTGSAESLPEGVELLVGDVGDPELIGRALKDVAGCFHLAAVASVPRSNAAWLGAHRTNLSATVGLFEAASGMGPGTPVVYASSAAVYGDQQVTPLTEDLPFRPLSPYSADKAACELHAGAGVKVRNLTSVGLRFFNVYGPGQSPRSDYSGVISTFADRVAHGAPLEVHGDGLQTRDFVFVGDVVEVLLAAMRRVTAASPQPSAEVFNVCSGTPTSIKDLAFLLMELGGRTVPLVHTAARPGDVRQSVGSSELLKSHLGLQPETPLSSGLKRTLSWLFEARKDEPAYEGQKAGPK
jgi:UDP-glucose 4-epimerase